jgi:uncharacterized SAM-binding protein YcdF (DUF218 family)
VLRLFRLLTLCVLALGSAIATIALWLDRRSSEAPAGSFDAIVVLGCRVNVGGTPSHALERRAEHAARLYHEGRAPLVVVTGGVGDHGPSEASVAAGVLARAGVPRHAILVEDASTSTWENARFARERFGGGRVLVVTDAFHTFRAERIFANLYDDAAAVGTRSPWLWPRAAGAVREVAAVAIYASLDRIDLFAEGPRRFRHPAPAKSACEGPTRTFSDACLPAWWLPTPDPGRTSARRARSRRRASRAAAPRAGS